MSSKHEDGKETCNAQNRGIEPLGFPMTFTEKLNQQQQPIDEAFLHDKETNSYWCRHCQFVFNLLADKNILIIKWGPWTKLDSEIVTII